MKSVHIVASQYFPCSAEQLFPLLKDSEALGKAAGLPMTVIAAGQEPGGPGSVRRVGPPVVGIEETILEVVPNEVIRYRISRNGGPIRNHRAEMRLRPQGNGTELSWVMNFEVPALLAGVVRPALTGLAEFALRRISNRLGATIPQAA